MATKKPNKAERVNAFILGEAQKRATEHVQAYLSKHPMGLSSLRDGAFDQAMSAITTAMARMYAAGVSDALATVEGTDLDKIA